MKIAGTIPADFASAPNHRQPKTKIKVSINRLSSRRTVNAHARGTLPPPIYSADAKTSNKRALKISAAAVWARAKISNPRLFFSRFFDNTPTTLNDCLATATETFWALAPKTWHRCQNYRQGRWTAKPNFDLGLWSVCRTFASSLSFSCFRVVLSLSSFSSFVLSASSSSWNVRKIQVRCAGTCWEKIGAVGFWHGV